MYFDIDNYLKALRFAGAQKHWPRRRRTLLVLTLWVPLQTVLHSVFFLLDYLLFPRLWIQRVEAPVFIVGHARSGTTLMHRLLALDEARFSFFLYWETFFPALSERLLIRGLGHLDTWILGGSLRRKLQAWDEKTFGAWRHIHEQGLWLAEEDLFVLRAAFIPQQLTLEMPLSHQLDIFHVDALSPRRRRRWMRHYRECVKRQLVDRGGQRTHLSKNPVMSGWVNALIETFPDARIVTMVRDPAECIPSTLKLVSGSWQAKGWTPSDCEAAEAALIRISFDTYHLPVAALAGRPDTLQSVVDYRTLIREPVATLERSCADIGLPVTDAQRSAAAALARPGGGHRSRFRYSLDEFPLTAAEIQSELAPFYARFAWVAPADYAENAASTDAQSRIAEGGKRGE